MSFFFSFSQCFRFPSLLLRPAPTATAVLAVLLSNSLDKVDFQEDEEEGGGEDPDEKGPRGHSLLLCHGEPVEALVVLCDLPLLRGRAARAADDENEEGEEEAGPRNVPPVSEVGGIARSSSAALVAGRQPCLLERCVNVHGGLHGAQDLAVVVVFHVC